MSRCLGGPRLTTLPPIATSPSLISSSPATMRSSVDLPQPDGPTSTQNSPSATVTSTACTTSVWPKRLRTCLSITSAMAFEQPELSDDPIHLSDKSNPGVLRTLLTRRCQEAP